MVELVVVLAIVTTIIGVAFYSYYTDRKTVDSSDLRLDKQVAIRRFLMWFRQDMQGMDNLTRFSVLNSYEPNLDSRVIEVTFDRFIDETDKEQISYRYDFNQRRLIRVRIGRDIQKLDGIINFQLMPYNYSSERIRNLSELENIFFFEARVVFSADPSKEHPSTFVPQILRIYPKLKASMNKEGYNRFNLNNRFD